MIAAQSNNNCGILSSVFKTITWNCKHKMAAFLDNPQAKYSNVCHNNA